MTRGKTASAGATRSNRSFMSGLCVGRGLLRKGDLGPCDEGGKYDIYEESDWDDSDSD